MAESNPTCSICLETFKDPTTIPCNHVFCSGCLKKHEEKNAREGRFACPLCNREVTITLEGVSGVRKEAIDQRDVSNEEVAPKCDVCGPKISATSRCIECEENYCQVCSVMHIKMKALRNHTLRDVGVLDQQEKETLRRREFCPKHPEEEIKIVCKTCKNIPLCLFCKIAEHDSHKSRILTEEVEEIKSTLETNLTLCAIRLEQLKICTKESEALDSRIDRSEQEEVMTVIKQEKELIRLLEDQKLKIKQEAQNFKESIRRVYEKVRKENDDCKKQIAKEFSNCVTLHSEARQLIDTEKESQIVQIGCNVKANLLEDSKRTGNIILLDVQRKAFTPAGLSMQKLEFRMGDISTDITRERKMNIFLKACVKEEPLQLLETEPFEKISQLRNRVMEKYSLLPRTKLVLKFGGKELTDYSISGYGLSNGSIIECSWSQPPWDLSLTSKSAIGMTKGTNDEKEKGNKVKWNVTGSESNWLN